MKNLLLMTIGGLKEATVQSQNYHQAAQIREFEREIMKTSDIKVKDIPKYLEKLNELLVDIPHLIDPRVGETFQLEDVSAANDMLEDADELQCAANRSLQTAEKRRGEAWQILNNKAKDFTQGYTFAYDRTTNTGTIISKRKP